MVSSLPWVWIIEALSDFKHVRPRLLQDLMSFVPDFTVDSCEIARERVSLRLLEEFLNLFPYNESDSVEIESVSRSSGPNVRINGSQKAADVLLKVTNGGMKCREDLKHALRQYILQRRACLPELALKQLKELILDGCHPPSPSLRESSGLNKEDMEYRIPAGRVNEHESAEIHRVSDNDCEIQSLKQNLATVVLENGYTHLQEDADAQVSRAKQEVDKQNVFVDDKERRQLIGDKVCRNNANVQSINHSSSTLPPDNSDKMHQETPQDGAVKTMLQDLHRNICVGEDRDWISDHHNDDDEDRGGEHNEASKKSSKSYRDQDTNLSYDLNDEMVAAEKHWFINSQSQVNLNSQAADSAGQRFCIKCDKGGHLLICSGCNCPLAVHESCIGSSVSFDGIGNFYCPFCSYSLAHAEYFKAKQKAVLARKALSSFMGRGLVHPNQQKQPHAPPTKQPSEVRAEMTLNSPSSIPTSIHAGGNDREITNDHLSMRATTHQRQGISGNGCFNHESCCGEAVTSLISERESIPLLKWKESDDETYKNNGCKTAMVLHPQADVAFVSSNGKSPCKGTDTSIISDRHEVSTIKVEENFVEMAKDGQCIREEEPIQQAELATTSNDCNLPCREAETTLITETHNVSNGKGDGKIPHIHHCISGSTHQKQPEAGIDHHSVNASCIEAEDSPTSKRASVRRKRKNAVIQQMSHAQDNAKASNMKKNEDISPSKQTKRQRVVKHNTTQAGRRTKLLWTAEEEEVLKEAVERFSTTDRGLPWTKILEYGRNVFNGTRTPVDLKDKWRNILIRDGLTSGRG